MDNKSGNSIWRGIIIAVAAAVAAAVASVFVTKTCNRISPEDNRVIISDTIRVVEANIKPQVSSDSLLYYALSELNSTLRETAQRNNSIKIVLPESGVSTGYKQNNKLESVVKTDSIVNNGSEKTKSQVIIPECEKYVNKVIDKTGFYKKGYTISDGASYFVLNSRPKSDDNYLTFEVSLIQSADLLSHIYLTICNVNEKGELYQYFCQTYEVMDGLNRIMIANNLRKGKNRIEIGVFKKTDEGRDYPTFYRNVFSLEK